ncbi:MAG: ABC transporter permease [Oscillospiraceae bacterium]|nr:ABC transporter permease [Oscillospiraceae bacterium]
MKRRESHRNNKNSLWHDAWRRLKKNKAAVVGMVWMAILILASAFAPLIAPYDYAAQDLGNAYMSPCWAHPFGTDNLGRDIFSRVLYGGRISLMLGIVSVGIAWAFAGPIGAIAGYYGGKVDGVVMRFIDVFQAIPGFLLSVAIAASIGTGMFNCMIAVGIGSIPPCARLLRGSILPIRNIEYIEAAQMVNATDRRIIFNHILPNVLAPVIINVTMSVGGAMLTAAALSFIGLGVQPPSPEWGAMLSAARGSIRKYPYMACIPGAVIFSAVLSLNMIGDGLRDALDPKLRN